MRLPILALGVIASTLRLCGGGDEPPTAASAPTATAEAMVEVEAEPAHGGVVVPIEDHQVEVVVRDDGEVSAYLLDAEARPVVDVNAQVIVYVPVTGGAKRPVMLAWDRDAHYFTGRLRGTAVVPGPVEVGIYVEGRPIRSPAIEVTPIVARVEVSPPVPGAVVVAGAPHAAGAVVVDGPHAHATLEVGLPAPPPPPSVHVDVRAGVSAGGGVVVAERRHVARRRPPRGKAVGHHRRPPPRRGRH